MHLRIDYVLFDMRKGRERVCSILMGEGRVIKFDVGEVMWGEVIKVGLLEE